MHYERTAIDAPIKTDDLVYCRAAAWFRATRGDASADTAALTRILPYLQVQTVSGDETRYLYCGTLTPAGALYGKDFCRTAAGKSGIPDEKVDRYLTRTYFDVVRNQRPALERVAMPVQVEGVPHFCDFYRFIFPLNLNGVSAVAALARFADTPTPLN
ncbi:hypothetical protein EOI86_06240 [Hwanghaeella grinnelliae]|uniref:PAS domain-containing protein n=1 Tax=Hwanghaeella grinnelliae TaxID=2500179 RepID=A0A437QWF8_9PROT|nr:hypothetical protein [Hwanghaeella grinnelliae]RVU38861.1 hypothetical protein EOI86_06240 [Hwanghaeella grinnelliae]